MEWPIFYRGIFKQAKLNWWGISTLLWQILDTLSMTTIDKSPLLVLGDFSQSYHKRKRKFLVFGWFANIANHVQDMIPSLPAKCKQTCISHSIWKPIAALERLSIDRDRRGFHRCMMTHYSERADHLQNIGICLHSYNVLVALKKGQKPMTLL